ncbi:DNA polymerase/3'-5' exonuclease PolX [candidate division KSB1 bacterium]|nr:DNA polymerase/3'-5' exonuclease PolX [candidate division KSB1 bacterium]
MTNNTIISEMFNRIADILEIQGESGFKVNAYRRASRVIEELGEDIEQRWQAKTLHELPGIGDALVKKIDEFLSTGTMKKYDEMMASSAAPLVDLLSIQNLGPKTVALMHQKLGVTSIDDIIRVMDNGQLATLPGMGDKKLENIRKGIELFQAGQSRITIGKADKIIQHVLAEFQERMPLPDVTPAGSFRRMKATIGDLDLLVAAENGAEVIDVFVNLPDATEVLAAGDTKGSIRVDKGIQVDLRVVKKNEFGAALQYFTGSQAHNVKLRGIARKMGLKINEYGVFEGERAVAGADEAGVYQALGLPWIPPELREDRGEIETAQAGDLPDLIEQDNIRGDLHVHTTYSDGHHSIAEMAESARQRGYQYIAICDHSRSAIYANGLSIHRLQQQGNEIDDLNQRFSDFTVLKGCEVDILPDGELDFPNDILATLDIVVASIHSGFTQNVTQRILKAIENPFVDIIAHPTGRLYTKRDAYNIDLDVVFKKAAETGAALEINSHPMRLDLSDIHTRQAQAHGVAISINTDAHTSDGYDYVKYGIGTARRGWAEAHHVINTFTIDQLRAWQRSRPKGRTQ